MSRKYFCQTASGQKAKDHITLDVDNVDSNNVVFGFESDSAPCNVYLNESQVVNLVDLLTAWLTRNGDTLIRSPRLWEDA